MKKVEKTYDVKGGDGGVRQKAKSPNVRMTVVATIKNDGTTLPPFFIEPQTVQKDKAGNIVKKAVRGMGSDLMKTWVENVYLPSLSDPKKTILILDNLNAHKNPGAKKLLLEAGVTVFYIPTYSVKYCSPLDNCYFAQFKALLRQKENKNLKKFKENIHLALSKITPTNIKNYCEKCGLKTAPKK